MSYSRASGEIPAEIRLYLLSEVNTLDCDDVLIKANLVHVYIRCRSVKGTVAVWLAGLKVYSQSASRENRMKLQDAHGKERHPLTNPGCTKGESLTKCMGGSREE